MNDKRKCKECRHWDTRSSKRTKQCNYSMANGTLYTTANHSCTYNFYKEIDPKDIRLLKYIKR